jgi:hypothetical protein
MDKVYTWIPTGTLTEILVSAFSLATNCTLPDMTWVSIDEKFILMLIMGRKIRKMMATIGEQQHIMAETKHWHSPLMSGSQKLEPTDRRTSIYRWKKWKRSSAGEESSSWRPCSHRLCRLPRLLRLRSRRRKENRAAGTTALSACQARKERRRAAASLDLPRQQSRNRNRVGRCLFPRTRLRPIRQSDYLQAMWLDRMACLCLCPCRCTLLCLTIHHLVQNSPVHKKHATAHARLRNTTVALLRLRNLCTPSTRHASTRHLVV